MNHPLGKFHRPRFGAGLRDSARGRAPAHRVSAGIRLAGQATFAGGQPGVRHAAKAHPPRRTEVHPTNVVLPLPVKKPRLRWYQYSLRTLLLLMLIVSLLMSWHAVKMKKATTQRKAVEVILAAEGTVEYDYQFDAEGKANKGAKGRGPGWLRDLLGPDYFDTVVHAQVKSVKGVEGANGLVTVRSLSIVGSDAEDPLKHLQDIDGLEELEVLAPVTGAGLERVRALRHLKRLKLSWPGFADDSEYGKQRTGSGLAALQTCPTLRELTVEDCEPSATVLGQVETLSQLEKLTISNIKTNRPVVFHINKLTALRELELSSWSKPTDVNAANESTLIVGGMEEIENLLRLERLTLSTANLNSADIKYLCKLPALHALDLSGCSKVDGNAVRYLQEMKGLKELNVSGIGITEGEAEQIDDALPNCRVIY